MELQEAVTLYYMYLTGTSEYGTIGNLFRIAKSTVCESVQMVCSAIVDELLNC